jgi:hypothetical protein
MDSSPGWIKPKNIKLIIAASEKFHMEEGYRVIEKPV